MDVRKLSTHVLNTSTGRAAANVKLTCHRLDNTTQQWEAVRAGKTDADGRCQLLGPSEFPSGVYKLTFHVGAYFADLNVKTLYPAIEILADCSENQHYHIPLLLNPYGYTTYRGT